MLPAAVANVTPIVAAVMPGLKRWNAPVDGGLKFRGKPLLGNHKTWRGYVVGVGCALLCFWLQQLITSHAEPIRALVSDGTDFARLPLYLGPLLGFGALFGDSVKSFLKRQRGIESGRSWVPFDQIDYIIGALLFSLPVKTLSLAQYAWIVVIWFVMHLLFSYLGYKWGLKDAPI